MSLNAIFRYPDLYRTAMAIAFISDQRLYDTVYQERYMGLPADNAEGYKQGSPITFAHQLKGNLLIVHGTGDDNCHYQSCEMLINELVKQNKQFSMMAYPNRSHAIREGANTGSATSSKRLRTTSRSTCQQGQPMIATKLATVGMLFLGALAGPAFAAGAATVTDLKCEYSRQPLGIDTLRPRLAWVPHSPRRADAQSAYRILVSGDAEMLSKDAGDLWDSGKIESSQSVLVPYGGKPLESGQTCYWKVRVWDGAALASDWSTPSTWEMGLLSQASGRPNGSTTARAIRTKDEDFYREDPAPLFRKDFVLAKEVRRARLYISGLGYYEASLNGERVGDRVLDPGWTRYSERALYSTYDVTGQLRRGTELHRRHAGQRLV